MDSQSSTRVFVSMGSNIDAETNLPLAMRLLSERASVVRASQVYQTAPTGNTNQPPFLNAAVLVETRLTPWQLKHDVLRTIESRLGRIRRADKNAPRPIDLDIALYGDLVVMDPMTGILLPDPEITTRAHIALPLADLEPGRRHPVSGQTLAEIAAVFDHDSSATVVPLTLAA